MPADDVPATKPGLPTPDAQGTAPRPRRQAAGRRGATTRRGARGPEMSAIPVLPLRSAVVLPGEQAVLPVGRAPSLAAVRSAQAGDGRLLLLPQNDPECERPGPRDLGLVGTLARVVEVEPDAEGWRVAVQGLSRAVWSPAAEAGEDAPLQARLPESPDLEGAAPDLEEAAAWLWRQLQRGGRFAGARGPEDAGLPPLQRPGDLADALGARLLQRRQERLDLLGARDAAARLEVLHRLLLPRLPLPAQDPELARRTLRQMQEEQRRYQLREQIRLLRRELGEDQDAEADQWRARLEAADLPPPAREAGLREAARLEHMVPLSAEAGIARTYLDWLLGLPWEASAVERGDLGAARAVLDAHHHGLDEVKERILEHLAVHLLRRANRTGAGLPPPGTALCLAGPPGTGKTSLARAMAEALGRPLARVALGGVRDEAEIFGHRRTYVGALPGRILSAVRRAGVNNPVLLLDELDKLGGGGRGDAQAALLEVLDPEQQSQFSDHYLEVPFDLSRVLFVATVNELEGLSAPLRDRLEVVAVPAYALDEKRAIARHHLLPRQTALHALPPGALTVTDAALAQLIREVGPEPGVRALERALAGLCRRAARQVLADPDARVHITRASLVHWWSPGAPRPPVEP